MRAAVAEALLRERLPAIVERVHRTFPQNPSWRAWALEWLAGKPDDDWDDAVEEASVAALHAWLAQFGEHTRPSPCVEGQVLGTDQVLTMRTATYLLSFLAFPEEDKARLAGEVDALFRELEGRLDRVDRERVPRAEPKLWRG